ncbi:hypothetical protein [Geodermatophilus ruber]|uniref:hypothetical protein n=1 Tax=Geodermatophilus ruber TaxID=504800 RepID=UPI001160B6FA|nr:hypothetical protein [Geodermatophilus ruber]
MRIPTAVRVVLVLAVVAGGAVVTQETAQAAALAATLVAQHSTSGWGRPSPDPSGITYDPRTNQLLISDGEVEETPLYAGTNLFVSSLTGQQAADFPGGTSLPWSREPTGAGFRPATGNLYVSDDDADRIFEVVPGADGRYGTPDDGVTSFSTRPLGGDAEDVTIDMDVASNGHLLVIDGVAKDVFDYGPGANGRFDGVPPAGDDTVVAFDVARYGARDPEGIEFHPERGTILVLDGPSRTVYELDRQGGLLNTISIAAANPRKAAGITLAPASNGSGGQNLYIVDRGVDNDTNPSENDGRFYELAVTLPPLPGAPVDGLGGPGGLDAPVRAGADDAEERASTGAVGLTSGDLNLGQDGTRPQTVALRFTGVAVPAGARVTNAWVQFQVDEASTAAASLSIVGEAAADAGPLTTTARNISARARTAATVAWAPAPWPTVGARTADQRTPALTGVLQEIVARPGWASGNALVLMVTGTGTRVAEAFNGGAARAPVLHVEYTV